MYASYDYYAGIFKGVKITIDQWTLLTAQSEAFIDQITFSRLKHGQSATDSVKMAVCSLAEVIVDEREAVQNAVKQAGTKSFSNDGYSETLSTLTEINRQFALLKKAAVDTYLPSSDPLRYMGV